MTPEERRLAEALDQAAAGLRKATELMRDRPPDTRPDPELLAAVLKMAAAYQALIDGETGRH